MNRLWRGLAIFVLGGVLGTGFGIALGFFFFPYVFPPPPAAVFPEIVLFRTVTFALFPT